MVRSRSSVTPEADSSLDPQPDVKGTHGLFGRKRTDQEALARAAGRGSVTTEPTLTQHALGRRIEVLNV
jgi:hypothetical protein